MAAVENRNANAWPSVSYLLDELEAYDEEMMLCSKKMKVPTAATPGEDVWIRLDLPPTPPRSPTKSIGETTHNFTTIAERLQLVSESLDDYIEIAERACQIDAISLRSNLIQDCMWGGKEPEKGVTCIEFVYETPCSTPPPLDYSSNDCVDPSAVFPYPLNENGESQQEDTDEEIDVVSLDKPDLKRKNSEPYLKECKTPKVLKRTRSLPVKSLSRSAKRIFDDSASDTSTKSCYDHRNCNDSDSDKRASHNVLERKRRNDLKSSFHTLRSYVPSLSSNEKAAKVIILKKATDYIHELRDTEESLSKEKDELKLRQRELLERFIKLKPKAK